jgi:hypothetical protein
LLLVLFLGIADFGRVFAAGITLEAAARNAAEVVAEEYRRNPPDGVYADQTLPAPSPGDPAFYAPLHELAARTACREAGGLANATFDPGTERCDIDPGTGEAMPVILVCVHDNADPLCEQPAFGVTIPDPQCSALIDPPENTMDGVTERSRYVEVRICYRFSVLITVAFLPLDDVWLQKARVFTVAYFPPPTPTPPPPPDPPPPEELPTPTPTPTPEETPTPTPTPEETPTPTPTPEETPTPTPTPEETPTPTPEETPA